MIDIAGMRLVTGSGVSPVLTVLKSRDCSAYPMDGRWNYFGKSRGGNHRMPKESVLRIPEMSCGVLEF